MDFPQESAAIIYDKIARIEARLAAGCSEKIQTLALVATFIQARDTVFNSLVNE